MRLVTLFLIAAFAASTVDAASYLKIDGTIVDPIMHSQSDSPHSYSGANLEPEADLPYAQLDHAYLRYANLSHANLTGAKLPSANLWQADLTDVRSGGINGSPIALPSSWQLTDGYLIGPGADLSGATLLNVERNSFRSGNKIEVVSVDNGMNSVGRKPLQEPIPQDSLYLLCVPRFIAYHIFKLDRQTLVTELVGLLRSFHLIFY
jgi:uncharacterized protein YjbI with pentapeptide repeats